MKPPYQLVDKKFGRLTVIRRILPNKNGYTRWLCQCSCGNLIVVLGASLVHENTKSCGCWYRDTRRTISRTHGKSKDGTYQSWASMIQRCHNPNHPDYEFYHGRGITVCPRWRMSFENFYADMGKRPEGLTIDRRDNSKGYEPGNCRWASRKEQSENSSTPVLITRDGITRNIKEWAAALQVSAGMLYQRRNRGQDMFRGLL